MPWAMAMRWAAMPRPVFSMASASAWALVTRLILSASASDWAASRWRWAALMSFIEVSTDWGRLMPVISVDTSTQP